MLKTCPVCKSNVFADMEVCYGCMHRFKEGEGLDAASLPLPAPEPGASPTPGKAPSRRPSEEGGISSDRVADSPALAPIPRQAFARGPASSAASLADDPVPEDFASAQCWSVRIEVRGPEVRVLADA